MLRGRLDTRQVFWLLTQCYLAKCARKLVFSRHEWQIVCKPSEYSTLTKSATFRTARHKLLKTKRFTVLLQITLKYSWHYTGRKLTTQKARNVKLLINRLHDNNSTKNNVEIFRARKLEWIRYLFLKIRPSQAR